MRNFVSLPFEKLDELFALIAQKEALYIPVEPILNAGKKAPSFRPSLKR